MLNPSQIKQAIEDVAAGTANVIDVRTDDERTESGQAVGATNFDFARIEQGEVPAVDPELPTYLFCRSGGRAGRAKTILQQKGFKEVYNLGGYNDWQASGGPTATE